MTSELVIFRAEVVLLLPYVPVQTLRQALKPVVDGVLETDGWDGEAGGGDGDAVGGVGEKEKRLSDGEFCKHDGTRTSCRHEVPQLPAVPLADSQSLEDNLLDELHKEETNDTTQSCYASLGCPQKPLRWLRNSRCDCGGSGPRS